MSAKKATVSMTFEERLRRSQEIVAALESGELALEESVRFYKEGLELSQACREQLEKARNEVRILTGGGTTQPFNAEAATEGEGAPQNRQEAAQ